MKKKVKNVLRRCTAAMLSAAVGMTTLAANVSAAKQGISMGYTWDSSINPTIYARKEAVSGGVADQYVKYGEQICRFVPSDRTDWAFCIEPAKSMQGTPSGTWYTQYGFNEYDTFDLTDKNMADSQEYFRKMGGTGGPMAKYLALVQYYGYSSHKNGNYYAATQCLIWELVLGYRGHTQSTFSKCSDVLWNDFTYPSGGWCTKAGVEKAYNDIVSNVKSHYNLPGALKSTKAQAKDEPAWVMKFNTANMRYQSTFKITSEYLDKNTLSHNFSSLEDALVKMAKDRFTGTYGKDYGIDKTESGGVTTFTVWSLKRPFTSTSDSSVFTTDAVPMQMKEGLKNSESLFAGNGYQTCLLSTRLDPVNGYVGLAAYNEPNLTVEKTFTDSAGNGIKAEKLDELLSETSFVMSTAINGTKYYVRAEKNSAGTSYVFSDYVTDQSRATKFVTLSSTGTKGSFTVNDLPTSASSGRTYTVTEYAVPDNEKYEKLSKSVTLPSPGSDFTVNAGTKTVKINNSENAPDAGFGTATLEKTLRSQEEETSPEDVYRSARFIVGYWDGDTVRYLSEGYTSAKEAFKGELSELDSFSDTEYTQGDGMYYVPVKLDEAHRLVFDKDRTSEDIQNACVFSAGYNCTDTETCRYFGQLFLNLVPLDESDKAEELFFLEVNGAKGYGYASELDVKDAINLSEMGAVKDRRGIGGLIKNDTGKSYTVTDENGKEYIIGAGKYYPAAANRTDSSPRHSDAEIVNEKTGYSIVLEKKDSSTGEKLTGAQYGLYSAGKKLLKTASTDENGRADFDISLVPDTLYYVREITAPEGYALDKEYYPVKRTDPSVSDTDTFRNARLPDLTVTAEDKPFTLRLVLNKYDVINNIPVENITFDVSLNGKNVAEITTDKDGCGEVSGLELGRLNGDTFENVYTVTERENDRYIMIDENGEQSRSFTVTTTLKDIEDNTDPVITYQADIPNTLQLVDLKVHKVDEFGNPVKGAAFSIVPTQDITFNGKTVQRKGESAGTIVTNENGEASNVYTEYEADGTQGYERMIPVYPNFEYELVELSAPEPYVIPEKNTVFTVTSEKADTITIAHEVTVTDKVQRGTLDVFKRDGETKRPLAGAEFEVRAKEDFFIGSARIHSEGDLICRMITDSTGHADTKDAVMYVGAKYTLTETKSAEGYALNGETRTFEFKFAGNTAEYSPLSIDVDNDSQKGRISVTKRGEMFKTVNRISDRYVPVFETAGLEGAVFEITAAEDIITADGTVHFNKGDIVAEITTDENGFAETELLYLGKYQVREIKAPFGHTISTEIKTAELTYAGQEVMVRDTVDTEFEDEWQRLRVTLSKIMERDELFGIGDKDEYRRVRFGLFAAEDINAADGSVIPSDGKIAELSLTEDMTAEINEKLPFAKYYVQEIATDEHYVLNGEKYLVNFEYLGQDTDTVNIDCGSFVNEIKRGKVKGKKINDREEPLADAVFGLFRAECTVFDSDSALVTATSDEKGCFEFDDVPFGLYIVREIKSPSGYVLSDKKHYVNVTGDEEIVEITAVNKPTVVKISKQDITDSSELPGALLQIIDKGGNVVEEWISSNEPHFIEAKLEAGETYTLREITAPDNYEKANDITFTVNEDGTVTEVTMKDEPTPDVPDVPDTPSTDNPHTGAGSTSWTGMILSAAVCAASVVMAKKKKEKESDTVCQ